jgi:hypothetical protein
MRQLSSLSNDVLEFASEYGVDVYADLNKIGKLTPVLVELDGIGRPITHVTDESGVDYYISRIDYYSSVLELRASRVIALVMPGYRTKSAYWPSGAVKKKLTIHRGAGYLIIGDPEDDESSSGLNTSSFCLDPEVTPKVTLPPEKFYTIEAASWSPEPLVISGLSKKDMNGKWENSEIAVEIGQDIVLTPNGIVNVPEEFVSGQFN